jgi:hypothetical protein
VGYGTRGGFENLSNLPSPLSSFVVVAIIIIAASNFCLLFRLSDLRIGWRRPKGCE